MLDGLDKIDLSAPDAMEQIHALAGGLSNKNAQLLEKLSGNKGFSEATAAELEGLRAFKSNSELKATEDAASYQEAKELTAAAHKADMLKLNERIEAFEKGERSRLITDGASKQMTELNVNPLHMQAQMALIKSMSEIVDGKAMIGDQTQAEYIAAWSETDSGKASILGQQNSNSGGLGGDNTPSTEGVNAAAEAALKSGDVQAYLAATDPNQQ
ncbi:MAG: hypothetical protein GY738_09165 [Pseudoalteromonas sp.]|nr:hypothetical protein [Pseudoalteromonas sp.]